MFSHKETQEQDDLTCIFYQNFQEEIIMIFHGLFLKTGKIWILTLFFETSVTLMSKPDKTITGMIIISIPQRYRQKFSIKY